MKKRIFTLLSIHTGIKYRIRNGAICDADIDFLEE